MDLSANKDLIAEIETVFADTPHPGKADSDLVTHFCPECLEVAERFRNIRWQDWKDRPLELIQYSDLCLLSPTAFRYALPLYMLATLKSYKEADVLPGSIFPCFHHGTYEEEKEKLAADLKNTEEMLRTRHKALGRKDLEEMKAIEERLLKELCSDAGKKMNQKIRERASQRIGTMTRPELRTTLKFLNLLQETHGDAWSTYPLKGAIASLQSVINSRPK